MSKKKAVLTGAERKEQMLDAGAKLAAKHGAVNVTRRMVAEACDCAEALVSVYMGDSASAKRAYARRAKAMGLAMPDKAKAELIGFKLRAHGPRDKRDTRKRSVKEVKAIKRKKQAKPEAIAKPKVKSAGIKLPDRTATYGLAKPQNKAQPAPQNKALPGPVENKERKTAARKPKLPPVAAPLPPSS
jgi:hypothetical protein